MKYIKFLVLASLALSSASINAGEQKQLVSQQVRTRAGAALATAGRVLKVGGYGLATCATGAVGIASALFLIPVGYEAATGKKFENNSESKGYSVRGNAIFRGSFCASSLVGSFVLTRYFYQKTKRAAQEIRAPKNA